MSQRMGALKRMKPEARARLAQGIADAASIIEAKGWCKGGLEDRQSRVCMMGSVWDAFQGLPTRERHRAYDLINQATGGDMTKWNDAQDTPAPVVAKLREVAAQVGPHRLRRLCPHKVEVCPGCVRAVGCWREPCSYGFRLGHLKGCTVEVGQ